MPKVARPAQHTQSTTTHNGRQVSVRADLLKPRQRVNANGPAERVKVGAARPERGGSVGL